MVIVINPMMMFRITARRVKPSPSLADKYPVKAEVTATAKIVAYHFKFQLTKVIAIKGSKPPKAAEKREAKEASQGFK